MKSLKTRLTIWLTSLSLLLPATPINTFGNAIEPTSPASNSQSGKNKTKISKDLLEEAAESLAPDSIVSVVVQTNGAESGKFKQFLERAGARVKGKFEKFDVQTIEIPARFLGELTDFTEVGYVSKNRELRSLGHLEITTGAEAMRLQTGNSSLKGKDFNIAVIDSGVYKDHHSFSGVPVNIDFTGENRVDDVYGHGSHVAFDGGKPRPRDERRFYRRRARIANN